MASRQELLSSIHPGMKLDKNFFLKVYGYELSMPGFAEDILSRLEILGCSKARNYYTCIVAEWKHNHDRMLRNVAEWYRRQDFEKKEVRESRKKQQEAEQLREDLRQKSDRELLILLQKLKKEKAL